MLLCGVLLAWQLLLPGFVGLPDNGDFPKVAGPSCLGSADPTARNMFFEPAYLRASRHCYDSHIPSSEIALAWLASSAQRRLGDPARFDIRWLGALHAIVFLAFYCALLRLLRPLGFIARLFLSLAALWIFADTGLIAYFNSFYADAAAILGALAAIAAVVPLMARKEPGPVAIALFGLAALLLTTSKPQHGVLGLPIIAFLLLAGRRWRDMRTRAAAYGSAAVLALGAVYVLAAAPDGYKATARFNVVFVKLAHNSPTALADLHELGVDGADARYIGTDAFAPQSPMEDAAYRERFAARTSFGRILGFYVRHPARLLAILQSDLRDEAWQRRPLTLSNYRKDSGFPPGALAGRFSSWSFLRMRLFRWWPAHVLVWYALVLPASLLFALRDSNPFRRALAWTVVALSLAAAGEFGIASLADACETSRHLLLFHIFTDCTFFFALVFAASRLEATTGSKPSWPVVAAALAGVAALGWLMLGFDPFQPRSILHDSEFPRWIDNTSPEVTYSGGWKAGAFGGAFQQTLSYSDEHGAAARFRFEGTAFEYVFTRAFNRGLALVTIDGVERGVIDLYEPWIEWRARTAFRGLQPGSHVAEIRVLGRRNPGSSGDFVDIDALAVPVPPPHAH